MRFLAVIQVSDDLTYIPVTQLQNTDQFKVDDWIIKANLDITKPGLISVQNKEETVIFYSSDPSEAGAAKLVEQVDGKTIVKTAKIHIPKVLLVPQKETNDVLKTINSILTLAFLNIQLSCQVSDQKTPP